MKAQTEKEKERINLLYAVTLFKILKDNSISSIRALSSKIGMEYTHLQRIARGKINTSISIHVAIIDALGISFSAFGKYYDEITENDIQSFTEEMDKQRKLRGRKATLKKVVTNSQQNKKKKL